MQLFVLPLAVVARRRLKQAFEHVMFGQHERAKALVRLRNFHARLGLCRKNESAQFAILSTSLSPLGVMFI
jgi:hypothetical protein